ncbi:hypothetical protein [Rothia aerolata]|uniref:Uncharacterized protein n=1 Tax=Rothia aerolata TaxID=1812262 RepID=A0A917IW20_9MICC|nr:hypothetical protein [Rothia aerolata]GGH65729.1 hypothetical protein GCM10007359_19260 [Rothia aerolata]
MKQHISKLFRVLYTIALTLFLAVAFTLVFTQIIGLIFAQPSWIDWAEETLEHPSIILAVFTGIFAFIVYNAEGTKRNQ